MPIKKVGGGYRWGNHGKIYRGKGGHAKAVKQAMAAHAAGYKGKKGK